jgi:hypothetical protein
LKKANGIAKDLGVDNVRMFKARALKEFKRYYNNTRKKFIK